MHRFARHSTAAASAELLERLGRLIRSREHEAGLNPAQWEALRYIARANRFSRNPTALTAWFGATKGTVSQTLIALEKKGLIAKQRRAGRGRAVSLTLTGAGQGMLARDPLIDIEAASVALGGEAGRLADNLAALLRELQEMEGAPSFGACRSCRHFAARQGAGDLAHRCRHFQADIGEDETERICIGHEPAA